MNEQIKQLEQQRDALVERLDTGATRIEEARARGEGDTQQVQAWENYWIYLLHEYEKVCGQISALHRAEVQKAQHQQEMLKR